MSDCLFCKIVDKQVPADIVHESEHVVGFRDINAQAPTHVLLVPRRHIARIADFDAGADGGWIAELFTSAARVAAAEGLDDGFRLVVNNGEQAGQSVFHVHFHLLGGRRLKWPPG